MRPQSRILGDFRPQSRILGDFQKVPYNGSNDTKTSLEPQKNRFGEHFWVGGGGGIITRNIGVSSMYKTPLRKMWNSAIFRTNRTVDSTVSLHKIFPSISSCIMVEYSS